MWTSKLVTNVQARSTQSTHSLLIHSFTSIKRRKSQQKIARVNGPYVGNNRWSHDLTVTAVYQYAHSKFFSIQISSHETVQDIRQVVLDRQESCFRTCVSLHFDGKRLDDFAELHTIEGLKDESVIKIVEGSLLIAFFLKLFSLVFVSDHFFNAHLPNLLFLDIPF